MNNLIRAEFYRLKHSSHLIMWVIGTCILGVAISFMSDSAEVTRQEFVAAAPMGMVISLMSTGIGIGRHYQNRTAFYEIMGGVSAHRIILSRICVYTPLILGFYFVPVSVILMIFDGGMDTVMFLLMFLIIFIRLLIFTICICLTFKTGEGVIIPYIRFVGDLILTMLFTMEDIRKFFPVLDWMPIFQMFSLSVKIDNMLIIKIIVGCVAECAVMYALAYTSHRKKWLIKTTLN